MSTDDYLYNLGKAIELYLNSIVGLSPRKLPIDEITLQMLSQRVKSAFVYELGDREFYLQPDENRNLILTLIKGEES